MDYRSSFLAEGLTQYLGQLRRAHVHDTASRVHLAHAANLGCGVLRAMVADQGLHQALGSISSDGSSMVMDFLINPDGLENFFRTMRSVLLSGHVDEEIVNFVLERCYTVLEMIRRGEPLRPEKVAEPFQILADEVCVLANTLDLEHADIIRRQRAKIRLECIATAIGGALLVALGASDELKVLAPGVGAVAGVFGGGLIKRMFELFFAHKKVESQQDEAVSAKHLEEEVAKYAEALRLQSDLTSGLGSNQIKEGSMD